jgi:cob(I)alamin adenosyltransferase
MKIYTKGGDKGKTSLLGGTRVPKHHIRIEAYGTTDELNSCIGLLIEELPNDSDQKALLKTVQYKIFELGASLATEPDKQQLYAPDLTEAHIQQLEEAIDAMQAVLPKQKYFVLPGGHRSVAMAHLCRTVCRRAERQVVLLNEKDPVHPVILPFLNRLSDYLFVVSRKLAQDFGADEVFWIPEK